MKTLNLSKSTIGLTLGGLLMSIFAFTSIVKADTALVVTTQVRNSANSAVTSATIGSLVHANVALASTTGPTPTGTVDFSFYPNTICSGTAQVQSGVALVGATADSSATSTPNTGLSYKVHYNGMTDVYPPTDGQCQPLTAISSSSTITGTLSTTTAVVGTSVHQSSVLGNVTANATGTVAYNVYTNNTCTIATTTAGTKTVTGGVVPNSDTVPFNTVGTFYWQAVYSGDMNNSGATSSCQNVVITAVPTPTPTPTPTPVPPPAPGTGSISGTLYHDLDQDRVREAGEPGLPGFTIRLYNGKNLDKKHKNTFVTTVTDANGNYSFVNLQPGTYSIEEIINSGWKQISGDFNKVEVSAGATITGKDFANASSTAKKPKDHKTDQEKIKKLEKRFMRFQEFFRLFKIWEASHQN